MRSTPTARRFHRARPCHFSPFPVFRSFFVKQLLRKRQSLPGDLFFKWLNAIKTLLDCGQLSFANTSHFRGKFGNFISLFSFTDLSFAAYNSEKLSVSFIIFSGPVVRAPSLVAWFSDGPGRSRWTWTFYHLLNTAFSSPTCGLIAVGWSREWAFQTFL